MPATAARWTTATPASDERPRTDHRRPAPLPADPLGHGLHGRGPRRPRRARHLAGAASVLEGGRDREAPGARRGAGGAAAAEFRSEEHTSELQSLMRISYAVFCLKKKINREQHTNKHTTTTRHN